MGTVYKKTVTRPLPVGAALFTKNGEQYARWKPAGGRRLRTHYPFGLFEPWRPQSLPR